MDLIGCPRCNERFLIRDAESDGWSCPRCRAEMRVVAHRIPDGIVTSEDLNPDRPQRATLVRAGGRPSG